MSQIYKKEGSFKAAEARYTSMDQINVDDLSRWLKKIHKNSVGLQEHRQTSWRVEKLEP